MVMNEIALFKGVRIQPYFKYIDFMFAGVFAFIFFVFRVYQLIQGYQIKYQSFEVAQVYQYFKPHFLYLVFGTIMIFVIFKMIAQVLIRFKEKDLAEMIETQGFHNRTVTQKRTEYLDIDLKKTEYDYYSTLFFKRSRKKFILHGTWADNVLF